MNLHWSYNYIALVQLARHEYKMIQKMYVAKKQLKCHD